MDIDNMIDEGGYMKEPSEWSLEFAREYANKMNIEWNEETSKMVQLVHDYIDEHAITPAARAIQKIAKKEFGWSSKDLYTNFPNGPKQIAMLAGGMKPSGC